MTLCVVYVGEGELQYLCVFSHLHASVVLLVLELISDIFSAD